jgi:hypothetical protein
MRTAPLRIEGFGQSVKPCPQNVMFALPMFTLAAFVAMPFSSFALFFLLVPATLRH